MRRGYVGLIAISLLLFSILTPILPVRGTAYAIQLRGSAFDGSSNLGQIWVQGTGSNSLPATIYLEAGQYTVVGSGGIFNGKKYDFDHWEVSGAISISPSGQDMATITVSGDGTLTQVLFKWDFTIDVTPSTRIINAGDAAIYQVTVTAAGGWTTNTGKQISVSLQPSGEPPGGSTTLGGPFKPSQSNPSQTLTYTRYTGKDTTPAGTYYITLTGTIESTSTTHAKTVELIVNSPSQELPDLVIMDFWWSPTNPSPGDTVTFTYTEANQGNGDAPAHRNTLLIDVHPISNDVVEALPAHTQRTRTFPDKWTATAGAHDALVKADDQHAVTETTEDNNNRQETIGTKPQISTYLTVNLNPNAVPSDSPTDVTISGRLTRTDTGAGISDRPVKLEWPGGMTTKTTDASGYYSHTARISKINPGTYTVTAQFDGYETTSTIFSSSRGSAILTIQGETPPQEFDFSLSVSSSSPEITQGQTETVTITVRLESGTTARVDLSISNWPSNIGGYGFSPSYGNPTFTSILSVVILDNAPTGTYSLTAVGSGGGKTRTRTITLTIREREIEKTSTSLTIGLDPASVTENTYTTVTISGRLTRTDTVTGLSGKTISLSCPGGLIGATTTDSSGHYSYSWLNIYLARGSYTVTASFQGDDTYGASSNTATLSVSEIARVFLSISTIPSGPDVPGQGTYNIGQTVTLSAPSQFQDLFFSHWVVDGQVRSFAPTTTVTMDTDHSAIAVYNSKNALESFVDEIKPALETLSSAAGIADMIKKASEGGAITFTFMVSSETAKALSKYGFGATAVSIAFDAADVLILINDDSLSSQTKLDRIKDILIQRSFELVAQVLGYVIVGGPFGVAIAVGVPIGLFLAKTGVIDWLKDKFTSAFNWLKEKLSDAVHSVIKWLYRHVFSAICGSDVGLLIVDPQGRRVGAVFENGEWKSVSEIPNAIYSGLGTHPQFIAIPNPETGNLYTATVVGNETGEFHLDATVTENGTIASQQAYEGTVNQGAKQEHTLYVSADMKTILLDPPWWVVWADRLMWVAVGAIVAVAVVFVLRRRRRPEEPEIIEVIPGPEIE